MNVFSDQIEITAEHITLRPTKLCRSVVLLCVAIWIGAVNYQVNLAYVVCFWLVGFVAVAALMTKRQLIGLKIECVFTDEVFVGETAHIRLKFSGGAAHRLRLWWWRGEYEQHIDEKREKDENLFSAWQRAETGSLNQHETIWAIDVKQRGYFAENVYLKLATSAPFGLFQAVYRVRWASRAVAYPAPLSHRDFALGNSPYSDENHQKNQNIGEDVSHLNHHQQGASLQHIAWKVYAKRGELMDKVFDTANTTQHTEIISYLDYPQGMPVEKLTSLLCHRVLQADKSGAAYTLILPHLKIEPQHGLRGKCLNALALW